MMIRGSFSEKKNQMIVPSFKAVSECGVWAARLDERVADSWDGIERKRS